MKNIAKFLFICLFLLKVGTEVNAQIMLLGSVPAHTATNVSVSTDITLLFSGNVSFGAGIFEIYKSGEPTPIYSNFGLFLPLQGNVTINGQMLTIHNSTFGNLEGTTTYEIRMGNDCVVGFPGITGSNYSFTTAAPPPLPLSIVWSSTTPAQNADNVALDAQVSITFSENISKGAGQLNIRDLGGNIVASILVTSPYVTIPGSGSVLTFSLSNMTQYSDGIQYGKDYQIDIPYQIGQPGFVTTTTSPPQPFTGLNQGIWYFSTEPQPPSLEVSKTDPLHNATGVPLNAQISLTFTDNIVKNSANLILNLRNSAGNIVGTIMSGDSRIVVTDSVLTFSLEDLYYHIPLDQINPAWYYFEVPANFVLVHPSSNFLPFTGFGGSGQWQFQTEPYPPLTIDWLQTNPAHGDQAVNINTEYIEIAFNRDIKLGSPSLPLHLYEGGLTYTIFPGPSIQIVDNIVRIPLTSFNLNPAGQFKPSTNYNIYLSPGFVVDIQYGLLCQEVVSTSWSFRTGVAVNYDLSTPPKSEPCLDTEPPISIVFTEPVSFQGTSVKNMTIFDETLSNVITISNRDPLLSFSGGGTSGTTLVLDPSFWLSNSLLSGTEYRIEIDEGFVKCNPSGVDFPGINDEDRFNWRFSTKPVLTITNTYPSHTVFDNNVPLNAEIIIKFSDPVERGTGYISLYDDQTNALVGNFAANSPLIFFHGDDSEIRFLLGDCGTINANVTYRIEVDAGFVVAECGVIMAGTVIWKFHTRQTVTWNGNIDNDWNEAGNWEGNILPATHDNVCISASTNYPFISSKVRVHCLTIAANAQLHHTGDSLILDGLFRMESSPTLNASYIKTGGDFKAERVEIEQVMNQSNIQTYVISSPVSGVTPEDIGGPSLEVFRLDNPTGQAQRVYGALIPGEGYMARKPGDPTPSPLIFSGPINDDDNMVIPVTRSVPGFGWNYVGNPYPTAIDWRELVLDNVEDYFYLWKHFTDGTTQVNGGSWATWSASGDIGLNDGSPIIPSNHGVQIKVKIDPLNNPPTSPSLVDGSITFKHDAKVPNDVSYLRSPKSAKVPYIKLAGIKNEIKDETAIALAQTTDDKDYNVEKYFSANPNLIQLYTQTENLETAIKGLIYEDEEVEIPLCFYVRTTSASSLGLGLGTHSIDFGTHSIKLTENFTAGVVVTLIDKAQGNLEINLSEVDSFSFDVVADVVVTNVNSVIIVKNTTRFALKISGNVYPDFHTISIAANDDNFGTVEFGTKTNELEINAEHNTPVTVIATPNLPYYKFENWTNSLNDIISLQPEFTFNALEDINLIANFVLAETSPLILIVEPENTGTVTGEGQYPENAQVEITASPFPNYEFEGWYRNNEFIANSLNYSLLMPDNEMTFIAKFQGEYKEIETNVNIEEAGTITGSGQYRYGTSATLTATPLNNEIYQFEKWTENDEIIPDAGDTYQFIVESDRNITAHFSLVNYQLNYEVVGEGLFTIEDQEGNLISNGDNLPYGTLLTITAQPEEGYNQPIIYVNGETLTDNSWLVVGNTNISAVFTLKSYTIIAAVIGDNGDIDPKGGILVEHGKEETFIFIPDQGYKINKVWIDNNENEQAVVDGYYTFFDVIDYHTIAVEFISEVSIFTEKTSTLTLYPNPILEKLHIIGDSHFNNILIFDISGKLIMEFNNLNRNVFTIDTNNLNSGAYFVNIDNTTIRVIKQ